MGRIVCIRHGSQWAIQDITEQWFCAACDCEAMERHSEHVDYLNGVADILGEFLNEEKREHNEHPTTT